MSSLLPPIHARLLFVLPLLLLLTLNTSAQFKISGTVLDNKDRPVRGASVYLDNTLDGATTDSMGVFHFTTTEKGNQSIVASEVSHETAGLPIVITGDISGIVLHIKANATHNLETVVITAGSFEATNDKSKTVLKPLDIVTTAGANADVVKAIEMLPGTQKSGTDNGMFVRGGDASEAAIVVDEMVVQNAFFSGPPGMTTRSRFGAFNYQGVAFSSGGYSARYGQALSSVLELNTTDLADKSNVNLGVNMAGLYASGTKKWKNSSLDFGGNYNNTAPFFGLAKTNVDFYDVPKGWGGNLRYVWKPNKKGILKVSFNNSMGASGIRIPNPFAGVDPSQNILGDSSQTIRFATNDQYYYTNASYKQVFKTKFSLYTAASYSLDKTDNKFGNVPIKEQDHRIQYRLEGKYFIDSRVTLMAGSDVQSFGIEKSFSSYPKQEFTETLISGYSELEWAPNYRLAVKPGVRFEHSTLLNKDYVAPRLSMALKTSENSQASLAGGLFYQDPDNSYMIAALKQKPDMQLAAHYIINWQYSKNDRILRLEGYYKNYSELIHEKYNLYDPNTYRVIMDTTTLDNSGHGYAQGLELFWRDKKTFKNVDYWITYSYIDTRRVYANYPLKAFATPTFIADHNLNLVGKYFVEKWQTNFSATYSFASGRPYYNPDKASDPSKFLSDRTIPYNNLAISVAYLHSFGKWFSVFYLSIDNVTDNHNIFGYRYSSNGDRTPLVPALYRSVFFGVNMSLSQFSKDEL